MLKTSQSPTMPEILCPIIREAGKPNKCGLTPGVLPALTWLFVYKGLPWRIHFVKEGLQILLTRSLPHFYPSPILLASLIISFKAYAPVTAYISGTMGSLIGADILH